MWSPGSRGSCVIVNCLGIHQGSQNGFEFQQQVEAWGSVQVYLLTKDQMSSHMTHDLDQFIKTPGKSSHCFKVGSMTRHLFLTQNEILQVKSFCSRQSYSISSLFTCATLVLTFPKPNTFLCIYDSCLHGHQKRKVKLLYRRS